MKAPINDKQKNIIEPVPVAITAYNDRKNIDSCLKSIKNQTKRTFIIINDSLSSDGTEKIIKKYGNVIIRKKTKISEGRNLVLKESMKLNKKYIVMVNSDIELPKKWMENAIILMERYKRIGALGGLQVINKKSLLSNLISIMLGIPTIEVFKKRYGKIIKEDVIDYYNVPCEAVIYRSETLKEIEKKFGYIFNEKLIAGEDPELSSRMRSLGYRTCLSHKLAFVHKMKIDPRMFTRQQILYGMGIFDWKINKFKFDYSKRFLDMLFPKEIVTTKYIILLPVYLFIVFIKLILNLIGYIKRRKEVMGKLF